MNKFIITIEEGAESFPCAAECNVLKAMERLGRKGIPVGCRGGGCGVCRVRVLSGAYSVGKMSREQVSVADEREGVCLACKLFPQADLRLRILGKMGKALQGAV